MSDLSARYHVVGLTDTGPTDRAVRVTNGADYHNTFGDRTPASAVLYDDVATFLAEGGREVWVTRVPALDAATITAALAATGEPTRGGAVAAPGVPLGVVGRALIAHAAAFGKVALLTGRQDITAEDLAGQIDPLIGIPGSDHAAVFWPWLTITGEHRDRYAPPTGYVAAVRARAHFTAGHARAPGVHSTTERFTALRTPNVPARNEELSERLISPLVTTRNGVQLHGWWSLAGDRGNFAYLDVRDLLNNVAVDLAAAYEKISPHSWDTVPKLIGQITTATKTVLATMSAAGAFTTQPGSFNTAADPGYMFTVTQPAAQPPDRNVIVVRAAVRPHAHANLIGIRVIRVPIHDQFPQEVTA